MKSKKEKKRLNFFDIPKKKILDAQLNSLDSEEIEDKLTGSLLPAKVVVNEFSFISIHIPILGNNTVKVSIFIIALLDFISFNLLSFLCSYDTGLLANNLQSETRNVKIIITIIFGVILFKHVIYNHQILSIFLILFWEKGLMEKNRLSPYKLLFFEGISGTIINLFALIPSYFIKCKNIFGICNERLYDIGETIEHMKEKEFWLFVLLLFVSSLCFTASLQRT